MCLAREVDAPAGTWPQGRAPDTPVRVRKGRLVSAASAAGWDHRGGFVHDHRATAQLAVAVQPAGDHLRHHHHLDPDRGECLQEWLDVHGRQVAEVLWRADGSGRALLHDAAGSTVRALDRLPGQDWPVGFVHALRAHLAAAAAALAAADGSDRGDRAREPVTGMSTEQSSEPSTTSFTEPFTASFTEPSITGRDR